MTKNILYIGAHNDDAEIFCGGILLQHKKHLNYEVDLAIMDHLDDKRKVEQAEANKISKFQSHYFKTMEELQMILLEIQPNIVITHWDKDRHPEHRWVSEITLNAMKRLKIDHGLPERLYFCSTYDHLGLNEEFSPTTYVDITGVQEEKIELIRKFTSQNPDHRIKKANILSTLYGSRIKTEFAEALKEVFYLGKIKPISDLGH